MNISIAIPDSCLEDEATNLDKSRKISIISRACSIFRVNTIYIYDHNGSKNDKILLAIVLKYLETPPFLRKDLFPKINELKYAGVLHPLKIPSHVTPANPQKIKDGAVRDGIVIHLKGKKFVDVGINKLIPYYGKVEQGKRITVKFKKGFPDLEIKEISKEESEEYWGYTVKERASLHTLVSTWDGIVVLTSRKGKMINHQTLSDIANSKQKILFAFGSPEKGLDEILGGQMKKIPNSKILNFFPDQATETVRMDEAILGSLAIINSVKNPMQK